MIDSSDFFNIPSKQNNKLNIKTGQVEKKD